MYLLVDLKNSLSRLEINYLSLEYHTIDTRQTKKLCNNLLGGGGEQNSGGKAFRFERGAIWYKETSQGRFEGHSLFY